jgi:hypothetical protein
VIPFGRIGYMQAVRVDDAPANSEYGNTDQRDPVLTAC